MRPSLFLAAIPFVLGCAQQSVSRAPSLPSDEPLRVRLYEPTAGNLNYELSEGAYVAIFAISRGQGISLIFPHFESQIDRRSHAGLNQETVHGGNTRWGYASSAGYNHAELFGHADAYYIVASKYPMPLEGMVQSPFLLRSLVGADVFRAMSFNDTWDAIESLLVAGLPDDAWASDVFLNWRGSFRTASWQPERFLQYCGNGFGYYSFSLLNFGACDRTRRTDNSPTPVTPVATLPRRTPPKQPLDRDPTVPLPPDAQIVRTFRSANEAIRHERPIRDTDSNRGESGRTSERNRIESARAPERESVRREPPAPAPAPSPPPARAPESRPQPQPAPETKSPQPQPDP